MSLIIAKVSAQHKGSICFGSMSCRRLQNENLCSTLSLYRYGNINKPSILWISCKIKCEKWMWDFYKIAMTNSNGSWLLGCKRIPKITIIEMKLNKTENQQIDQECSHTNRLKGRNFEQNSSFESCVFEIHIVQRTNISIKWKQINKYEARNYKHIIYNFFTCIFFCKSLVLNTQKREVARKSCETWKMIATCNGHRICNGNVKEYNFPVALDIAK